MVFPEEKETHRDLVAVAWWVYVQTAIGMPLSTEHSLKKNSSAFAICWTERWIGNRDFYPLQATHAEWFVLSANTLPFH